jgi:LCP family protein required for cell wall assembly
MTLIIAAVVILLAAAVLCITSGVFGRTGISHSEKREEESGAQGWTAEKSNPDAVVYDGKTYVYNDHLTNYLLLGVDTDGSIQDPKEPGSAGQSDSVFLISYDRVQETTVGLAIPRDTITQIERFTPGGESLGFYSDHLNLQYAYGDGKRKSCELTSAAVSRLLSGLPIGGYAAINLDSIPRLTQLLGGVEVTVPDDSLSGKNPAFVKGNKVILDETNTEIFVRSRDTQIEQSAITRMNRQKVFLEAFASKLAQEQQKDASTVTTLFETMKEEMVTNMSNDQFVDIAVAERTGGIQTIPGETGHEDVYDVYRVDDAALYRMVLELFYTQTGEQ